jgi:hypothetical protein
MEFIKCVLVPLFDQMSWFSQKKNNLITLYEKVLSC